MQNTAPRWLLWVSIILLLWNLMGVGAFVSQWMMSADQLATLPPEQQVMWAKMPSWAWAAYAVAVFAGTAGAIGLFAPQEMGGAFVPAELLSGTHPVHLSVHYRWRTVNFGRDCADFSGIHYSGCNRPVALCRR